mgnify:CR=1 FL=1
MGDLPSAEADGHLDLVAIFEELLRGAEFDIAENVITIDAEPIPIPKKKNTANYSIAYSDLLAASERLSALIKDSDGRTNADMRQLTEAIHKLCDDWKL